LLPMVRSLCEAQGHWEVSSFLKLNYFYQRREIVIFCFAFSRATKWNERATRSILFCASLYGVSLSSRIFSSFFCITFIISTWKYFCVLFVSEFLFSSCLFGKEMKEVTLTFVWIRKIRREIGTGIKWYNWGFKRKRGAPFSE